MDTRPHSGDDFEEPSDSTGRVPRSATNSGMMLKDLHLTQPHQPNKPHQGYSGTRLAFNWPSSNGEAGSGDLHAGSLYHHTNIGVDLCGTAQPLNQSSNHATNVQHGCPQQIPVTDFCNAPGGWLDEVQLDSVHYPQDTYSPVFDPFLGLQGPHATQASAYALSAVDPVVIQIPFETPFVRAEVFQGFDGRYFCSQIGCDVSYARAGDCRRHLKKHNGPFLYCHVEGCAMKFYRNDKLQAHVRQGHGL